MESQQLELQQPGPIGNKMDEEVRKYVQLRRLSEEAAEKAKEAKRTFDEQRDRLFAIMEAENLKTMNHDQLGRFTRTERLKAIVKDPKLAWETLDDMGLIPSVTKTAWKDAALNKLIKDALEAGEEVPAGLDILSIKGITYTANKTS